MNEFKNPVYPQTRSCFIDCGDARTSGECSVVDYVTYHAVIGDPDVGSIHQERIPEGQPYKAKFQTKDEALKFCREQNFLVCQHPDDARKFSFTDVSDRDEDGQSED